jgi:hypothetical protein
VAVSETVLHMADVVYGVPATKSITIENVGEVAATWHFVPKPEEKWLCKVSVSTVWTGVPVLQGIMFNLTADLDVYRTSLRDDSTRRIRHG